MMNLKKMSLKQLQQLAEERFGTAAFMLADKESLSLSGRGPLYSKEPWIRLLSRSSTPEDLIQIARHKEWQHQIQREVLGEVIDR